MVVKIEEIGHEGLTLDQPVSTEALISALKDGRDTGYRAHQGFDLHAEFRKVSAGVILKGNFRAEVTSPCIRCLTEVITPLPVDFLLNLVPESLVRADDFGKAKAEDDGRAPHVGSFGLSDADHEIFDGKTIDLDPIVREQVLLALPMQVVCSEKCKGLCPVCGQDLNKAECGCERKVIDPRLVALKDIKIN